MFSRLSRFIPLLVVAPAAVAAQATIDSVAGQLHAGQLLRLHLRGGQRLEGRFAVYSPAPPALRLSAADTLVPVGMIDSLWVRGSAAKSGAIIGALVLGVPSAIVWQALCERQGEGTCGWGTVYGLTAVGALLGAAIGSASPRWHLRYAGASVGLRLPPLPEYRLGAGVSLQFHTRLR